MPNAVFRLKRTLIALATSVCAFAAPAPKALAANFAMPDATPTPIVMAPTPNPCDYPAPPPPPPTPTPSPTPFPWK